MNFKEWKEWYKSLHWTRKWYVILNLIRPITDNFYELKQVSIVLSPLYIIGVLTPVFIIASFTNKHFSRPQPSPIDVPFSIWSAFVVFNCIFLYAIDTSIAILGDIIKYIMPIFLFFYCRRFVRDKRDLLGICQTFVYAALFPIFLILYESFVDPIAIEYMKGRGGGSRIRGGYGDIMNYALYTMCTWLIISYYFISKNNTVKYFKNKVITNLRHKWFYTVEIKPWFMMLLFAFMILTMNAIKHVATWGVFLMLLGMLMLFNLKNIRGVIFVALFSLIIIPFFAEDIYIKMIAPLTDKEVAVAEGDNDIEGLGNGRMTRWEKYFEVWEQMPAIHHFVGVSFSGFKEAPVMMSLGMHSDYVRNLFLTGIIGALSYVIFLFSIVYKGFMMRDFGDKFLILSSAFMIIMYSLSTMPTLYAPFLYIIYCIWAYALLPKAKQN